MDLFAINAKTEAYEEYYVKDATTTAGNASTMVSNFVKDKLKKEYASNKNKTVGLASIEASEDGSEVIINTTDFEMTGEVEEKGGNIIWGEVGAVVPGLSYKVETHATTNTTHNSKDLTSTKNGGLGLTWSQLKTIAKSIAKNRNIDNSTIEIEATMDSTTYTIGIGDTATVYYGTSEPREEKTVRLLGFNHDRTNGETGISFDFMYFIGASRGVNDTDTNVGGWANSTTRADLNDENGIYLPNIRDAATGGNVIAIKGVNKPYNIGGSEYTNSTSEGDKLWLLSCAEIWPNYTSYSAYYDKTEEGLCYPYFIHNTSYVNLRKNYNSGWWLRSPHTNYNGGDKNFLYVAGDGIYNWNNAAAHKGMAPGFTI